MRKTATKPTLRPTEAICLHEVRGWMTTPIERGTIVPLDHPAVRVFPSHFRAILPIEEVTNDGE